MLSAALVAMTLSAGPVESSGVQSLMEWAANQSAQRAPRKGDPVPTGLLLAAMAQAEALLEHDGVPLDGAAEEWLRERLVRRLEAEFKRIPSDPGLARREAWEHLVREVTTAHLAQQVLDAWLELPPLVIPESPAVTGTWVQATQTEGSDSFTLDRVTVVDELGSQGQDNELIDPGEWVKLEVTFLNATKLPWFSTSAFPRAIGCLWVDEKHGAVVGEMNPGGRASVQLWAYVPEHCTEASALRLTLSDTHRGTPSGAFTITLTPTTFTRPHATRAKLDTDALGSSDGSRLAQVGPAMRFEFVADVKAPGDAVSGVISSWTVPASARPLYKSLLYRLAPSVALGGGLYSAGDDLDGATVDEDEWATIATSPALERWMVAPASGRLWLAMDTVVVLSGAPPAPMPVLAPPSTRKGPHPMAPAPVSAKMLAPSAASVAELVKQYVELEPHAVPREKPNAVEAVSGYELLFDRAGFMKAYEALLAPPPTQLEPVVTATARYVMRSYFAVPAVPVEKPLPRPVAVVERAPLPPPPPEAPKHTWLQLDLGGGVSTFPTHATTDLPGLWGGSDVIAFPTFSARAFIGPSVVGVLAFHYVTLTYNAVGTRTATFTEISGDIGVGYRFGWERVSLTPYGALLLRLREHSLVSNGGSIGGLVGLNLRVKIASWFGLSVDLAVPLALGGPYGLEKNVVVDVVGGIGLRSTLNASISF